MKYIFITGMGRSGTASVANILSSIDKIAARHEYIGNREFWLLSWYMSGQDYSLAYLQKTKNAIEDNFSKAYFIDVNGYLQNCVPALRQIFHPEYVYHLVRDGRDVVRSIYSRRNDQQTHLIPKKRQEIEKWLNADKFEQICWNWAATTENLISENTTLIQFEKLISDHDYFKDKILIPNNFHMDYSAWKILAAKKINRTRSKIYRILYARLKGKQYVRDSLPVYDNWTQAQKNIFWEICGPAMDKAGYSRD